jgi:hypothetical protein
MEAVQCICIKVKSYRIMGSKGIKPLVGGDSNKMGANTDMRGLRDQSHDLTCDVGMAALLNIVGKTSE